MRADRLKKLREAAGYNQYELAALLRTGVNQIGRWERGENVPSATYLMEIAQLFGVSADYILGLVEQPQELFSMDDLSPLEQKLIKKVRDGSITEALEIIIKIGGSPK